MVNKETGKAKWAVRRGAGAGRGEATTVRLPFAKQHYLSAQRTFVGSR